MGNHSVKTGYQEKEGFSRAPYHRRYYLLFGQAEEPSVIDANATLMYLNALGFDDNALRKARKEKGMATYLETASRLQRKNTCCCDFCGREILGVEYETLADGRDRCISCSRTAVRTEDEFIEIFEDTKRNMESLFDIRLTTSIQVQMVNSDKLHKALGHKFVPTPKQDGRILGVAINRRGNFSLLIENGAPKLMAMLTMAHELTHIWQYLNWDEKKLKKKYGKKLILQVYEGMAKWVEVQYAFLLNEINRAKRVENETLGRDDEYGHGYIRYKANYPLSTGTFITSSTPFMFVEQPLDPIYCTSDVSTLKIEDNSFRVDIDELDDDGYSLFFEDDNYDMQLIRDRWHLAHDKEIEDPGEGTQLRTPGSVTYYAYELLDEENRYLYEQILAALQSHTIILNDFRDWVTADDIDRVLAHVAADHPDIFWFQGRYSCALQESGTIKDVQFYYSCSLEEAKSLQKEIEKAESVFMAGVTDQQSDFMVVKTIYENIVELVDYDSLTFDRAEKKNKANIPMPEEVIHLGSVYGALVKHRAVCAGYAKAFQYLLQRLGIECAYVRGTVVGYDAHAWNLIQLENDYYYMDVTWGDRSNTKPEKDNSSEISYNYFCVTSKEMLYARKLAPEVKMPECTARKCNYYYRMGYYLDEYDLEKVKEIVQICLSDNVYHVPIKCSSEEVYEKLKVEMLEKKGMVDILGIIGIVGSAKVKTGFQYREYKSLLLIEFLLRA